MKVFKINELKINEISNQQTDAYYRWRESYNDIYHKTKCKVLSSNEKTTMIELLEFEKDGKRPGTKMRVYLKSLIGFKKDDTNLNLSWKNHTYFD